MPTISSKPTKQQKPEAAPSEREVLYPEVSVEILDGEHALTEAGAKALLRWETEQEAVEREMAKYPTEAKNRPKPEQFKFGDDDEVPTLLKDEEDNKIKCWNNARNRPFKLDWSKKIAQDILAGAWKFNLETIIITKTGIVGSGQHRLIGLILANQLFRKNPDGYPYWVEKGTTPTIECLVAFGCAEDHATTNTYDNVMPRALSDVIYTSEIFADLTPSGRRECSRMLDTAVDTLWRRTRAGSYGGRDVYQTHSASMDFLDRHKKLSEFVKHIYRKNTTDGRAISGLDVSPGYCAALEYLMASSTSDIDDYLGADGFPSEGTLKWKHANKAKDYWNNLAAGSASTLPVKHALNALGGGEGESQGTPAERYAIICAGWHKFAADEEITPADLELSYGINSAGKRQMVDPPLAGGIDQGEPKKFTPGVTGDTGTDEDEPSEKEKKAQARRAKAEAARKAAESGNGQRKPQKTLPEELAELRGEHPDSVFLFVTSTTIVAWGPDATVVEAVGNFRADVPQGYDGLRRVTAPSAARLVIANKLSEAGHKVAFVTLADGKRTVTHYSPPTIEGNGEAENDGDEPDGTPDQKPAKKPRGRRGTAAK